ncbi:MAG TPA: restriction endonuclease subunit S [Chryseolinea sp.]
MSARKKNMPNLRFPEFRESWNSILLEDVAIRGSGHTPSKSNPEYYKGDIKWISLADSKKLDNGYIEDTEIKISPEGIKNSSAVLHPKGSVLLSRDAGVGKSAVMKHEMAVSQHFIVWQAKENILSNWFLYNILQILKPEFERIAIGNTIKTIGLPYFKKLKIRIPGFSEQQKIASFLSTVDKKVQLLTRKKELLEQYKKGVMQQLFSGKLRFKDENGKGYPNWKEKRLGDILKIGSGRDYKHLGKGNIPVFGTGGYMLSVNEKLYSGETVFLGRKGTIDKPFYFNGDFWTVDTLFFTHEFKDALPKFIYIALQQTNLKLYNEASGVPSLSKTTLEKIKLSIPSVEEQQKISDYIFKIDTKIRTITAQITQTQTFKKGLLQQMFV